MEDNIITRINGPVVYMKTQGLPMIGEQVLVGDMALIGEVIEVSSQSATIQVYEETTGLVPGMAVQLLGRPLSVMLGPGLVGQVFDGIQRPLSVFAEQGLFIPRGSIVSPLDQGKAWTFTPSVSVGDDVGSLDIIGEIKETALVTHRVMVPHHVRGTVVEVVPKGDYTVDSVVAKVKISHTDTIEDIRLHTSWPIRKVRPVISRAMSVEPLFTGQRVLDFFFPLVKGGAAAIPGGFGTGKTITQHQVAKWCDADIIIYIGCGERGNEITQVLEELPQLIDPVSGRPLIERTIIIANTSNMPVTAREASIYTGITLAEYYRDMGYHVALMADSTSRWAEALREISGRLEEMPAEEGYPAYLASRLAEFYERAGLVQISNRDKRFGSISIIGAVSPQGGDFSEPVTQHTGRFIRAFWALDKELAGARHFPSVNWNNSYSDYVSVLDAWWEKREKEESWSDLRAFAVDILQQDNKLQQVVKLVGEDSLPDKQRLILETARMIKDGFLQQDAFNAVDAFCSAQKQLAMMDIMKYVYTKVDEVLEGTMPIVKVMDLPVIEQILRMKYTIKDETLAPFKALKQALDTQLADLMTASGRKTIVIDDNY